MHNAPREIPREIVRAGLLVIAWAIILLWLLAWIPWEPVTDAFVRALVAAADRCGL